MAAPGKCSVELQQRATRMAMDLRKEPESAGGAIKQVADELGVHPEALRTWVRHAAIDGGVRPGTTGTTGAGWSSSSVRSAICAGQRDLEDVRGFFRDRGARPHDQVEASTAVLGIPFQLPAVVEVALLVDASAHLQRLQAKQPANEVEERIQATLEDPNSYLVEKIRQHLTEWLAGHPLAIRIDTTRID